MTDLIQRVSAPEIKAAVAERYGQVANAPDAKFNFPVGRRFAESVGYEPAKLDQLPRGTWESFTGAGNPQPFVALQPGETLLDLGCGAGLDLCLYAERIGPSGKLYGLDLSQPMLDKAGANLRDAGVLNVEWLHASADAIPLPDNSIDIVTANGIHNLSPDKDAVMREVARVLRPGGRTVFAEIVLAAELPGEVRRKIDDWFRCIGGAQLEEDFLIHLQTNGLVHPEVLRLGRNARTGHELARCAVIRAEKAASKFGRIRYAIAIQLKRYCMFPRIVAAVCLIAFPFAVLANDHGTDGFKLNVPDEIEWTDGPPSLPKGAQIAVLEGDPTKEGPFVFRVKAPDGYRIPVHTHPKTERVTVISGTFHIGMGDTFDKDAAKPMKAGTYGYWESGMRHFVWIEGETIVQFHGEGPWKIEYVNPADDPRNQK